MFVPLRKFSWRNKVATGTDYYRLIRWIRADLVVGAVDNAGKPTTCAGIRHLEAYDAFSTDSMCFSDINS